MFDLMILAGCLVFYGHDVVINDLNKLTLDRFPDELKKKKQQLQQSDLILDQPFSVSNGLLRYKINHVCRR